MAARFTVRSPAASSTPGWRWRAFWTVAWQAAQVMPSTGRVMRARTAGSITVVSMSRHCFWALDGAGGVAGVGDRLADVREGGARRVVVDFGRAEVDAADVHAVQPGEGLLDAGDAVPAAHAVDLESQGLHGELLLALQNSIPPSPIPRRAGSALSRPAGSPLLVCGQPGFHLLDLSRQGAGRVERDPLPAGGLGAIAGLGVGQGHGLGVAGGGLGLPDGEGEVAGAGAVAQRAVGAGGQQAGETVGEETVARQDPQPLFEPLASGPVALQADEGLGLAQARPLVGRIDRHGAGVLGQGLLR